MIVATRNSGNVHVRSSWPDNTIREMSRFSVWSSSGQPVTMERAVGLPALGRAIRLVSGMIAASTIGVYEGRRGEKRERPDTWQAQLLEDPTGVTGDWTRYDWLWDIASSLEAVENAVVQKVKAKGRIVALQPVSMDRVRIYRNREGEKVIEVTDVQGGLQRVSSADFLHIRGQTVGVGVCGVSRITQHRDPLGSLIAAQIFEGAYFRNHARPDVAIIFPQGVSKAQAEEWRPEWDAGFGGPENAGKPLPLGGGADIKTIPINMRDAQFIESRQFGVAEIGRMMDVDASLLGEESRVDVRKTALELFLKVQLPPRLGRIVAAFKHDPDFFGGVPIYPQFDVDDLQFSDPLTRAQVQHYRVQDGTELVDEARADNGRPPLPPIPEDPTQEPGKVPQMTPVGGAPTLPVPGAQPPAEE